MRSKLSLSLVLSFFAVTMTLIAMVREFLWAPPRAFAQGVPPGTFDLGAIQKKQ
jgi:hypothetical protein